MHLPEPFVFHLSNQTPITIRPIQPTDASRLMAFYGRLSPETIYLRFLSAHPSLTPEDFQRLSTVDYQTHMAFVAVSAESPDAPIIGVARYVTLAPDRPHEAESAIVVEDRFQGQGIGSHLMQRLVLFAREHDVHFFVAEINVANEKMLRFIQRSGLPSHRQLTEGLWEVRVELLVG